MTAAEILELTQSHAANAMTAFSIYLTVTFAYLIASYLVGAKLSKFQATLVSGLYAFGASSALLGCVATLYRAEKLGDLLESQHAEFVSAIPSLIPGELWPIYMAVLLTTGIAVSLYFMHDIRRKGA